MIKNQEYAQQYAEYAMLCYFNITWHMLSIKLCILYCSYYWYLII